MVYTVVAMICIAVMIGIIAYLLKQFLPLNREERIEFINNFKKGKCAIIYVVAVPLFYVASIYVHKGVMESLFDAITKSVNLVVLKYDTPTALIGNNTVFAVAIYMCFTLVIINAAMITISILHHRIWSVYRLWRFYWGKGDKCIILGNNIKSSYIYNSCKCQNVVVDVLTDDARRKLYIKGITYKSFPNGERLSSWLRKYVSENLVKINDTKDKICIIINYDNEQTNLMLCGRFVNLIKDFDKSVADNIDVYVFGNREFENIYSKYEDKSRGCLHYINEYSQLAIDFIDKYPLTEFMNEKHIDYTESLIYGDVDINVSMIGFGRTNQEIFLSMVANNQFLTKDADGNIVNKPVSYHLFDKHHTDNHKNLNHNYFRYEHDYSAKNGIKENEAKYLPLPEMPEKHDYHYLDINDIAFYDDLKSTIGIGENAINYIIVSLGDDYLNIDMANKIASKFKEWKMQGCKIFVRVRSKKIADDAKVFFDMNTCYPFGTEADVVYDYSHIIQEKFSDMAIMRNFVYDIEHDMKHDVVSEGEMQQSRIKWFVKRNIIERESNVYACLSLRSKLHLMGLDYCERSDESREGLSADKYLSIYAKGDLPIIEKNADNSPKAIRYSIDFKESRRKNMAIQEHSRWNAYMLMNGFVPATIDEILTDKKDDGEYTNGKNYDVRQHGNLTTYDGLVEFRKLVATRDKSDEASKDVIKYDYQLLDGAWWLLHQNGFKIVKR